MFIAHVGREIELTNGCIIGASCSLTEPDIIPENTIIYGNECQRREMHDKPYVSFYWILDYIINDIWSIYNFIFYYLQPPISQIEFLLKILPSYHHIRKANVKPNKNEGGI